MFPYNRFAVWAIADQFWSEEDWPTPTSGMLVTCTLMGVLNAEHSLCLSD